MTDRSFIIFARHILPHMILAGFWMRKRAGGKNFDSALKATSEDKTTAFPDMSTVVYLTLWLASMPIQQLAASNPETM